MKTIKKKSMKLIIYTIVMLTTGILFSGVGAGYTPPPESPLATDEHPRLHITQETLPYFRSKIANYYPAEYQNFVNWVDAEFDVDSMVGTAGLMSEFHALIYLLGPIDGITYQHAMTEYGNRAIEIMMNEVAASPIGTLPRSQKRAGKAHNYRDDVYSIMARSYDWAYDLMTQEEKATIAGWLADSFPGQPEPPEDLFSSKYFGQFFPWYVGLSFYNDGVRDQDAQRLVDYFEVQMLNGAWLDAQNWVAREHGGITEVGTYGFRHATRHIIGIDGWRTGTGKNYFAEGTNIADADFVQYHPLFVLYRIKPFGKSNPAEPGGVEWKAIKLGQIDAGAAPGGAQIVVPWSEPLKTVNSDMASLNRWLIENRIGEKLDRWNSEWHYILHFLWGDRTITPKSPQQLGLPKSQLFEGLGIAVMRTGFDDTSDTAILVAAPTYRYYGHDWGPWTLTPMGFNIDKYGPLVFKQMGYIRGAQNYRKNTMRFTDPLLTPDSGFAPSGTDLSNIQQFTPSSENYLIGMQKTEFNENSHDYLFMDYTRYYTPERVSKYTRQFVYLRPQTNQDSDYIVIFDRTETTRPDIIKRWELNMAYNPEINGQETQLREGKWEYTEADEIIISNNVSPDPYSGEDYGGHGRLFVKTLSPKQAKIVKVGGPDHEFEFDDGTAHGYKGEASDYDKLHQAGAFYTGTYHTDVVALENNTKENFLHVLQTADANLVSQMIPATRIDGDTMVGAHIQDDIQGHKVAMFSRTEENQTQVNYSISTSQTVDHLIADLYPFETYEVYQDGELIGAFGVSEAGTIYFQSTGGGNFQVKGIGINNAPTVEISAEPTTGGTPLTVQFTSQASDSDGTVESYSWDFGDGETSTEQSPSHTYQNSGTYTATLTVTDDKGKKGSDTVEITVNNPPTVEVSAEPTSGGTPLTVQFTSTAQDFDGTVASYLWDFGDSNNSTEQNPTHTYNETNTYTATLTVTDNEGAKAVDTVEIKVVSDPTPPEIPQGLSGTAKDEFSIDLTWQASTDAETGVDSYKVYRDSTLVETTAQTSYTDTGLMANTTYSYQVSAVNGAGLESDKCASQNFTTKAALPPPPPVAHWKFDEGTGAQTADSSGNENTGTIQGATWIDGKINGGLSFDGTDDYVDLTSHINVDQNYTVSMWLYLNDTSVGFYLPGAYINPSYLSFMYWAGGDSKVGGLENWQANQWYHVVYVLDDKVNFYRDGVYKGSDTLFSQNISVIGAQNDGNNSFNGLIDDVRIYDEVLTVGQIQEIYNQGVSNLPPTITTLTAEPTTGEVPLSVNFTAQAEDSDGTIQTYSWDFGDEDTSTEQNPTHIYNIAGNYITTLTVTDNGEAQTSDTIEIKVVSDSTPPTIPQGLSGTAESEFSISLTWQASSDPESGVDSYKVYRDETLVTTTAQTSYMDTDLMANTTYSYRVSAVNGAGLESDKCASQEFAILPSSAAHWKFDEGTGTQTTDSSGNGNTGTIKGTTWTDGKINGGLSFDGVDDYISLTSNINVDQNYTVSMWLYLNDTSVGFYLPGAYINPSYLSFMYWAGGDSKVGGLENWQANQWYHVVYVLDDKVNFYRDGVYKGSDTLFSQNIGVIGSQNDGNNPFNGLIDDVRIYDQTLTVGQIQELYNQGVSNQSLITAEPTLEFYYVATIGDDTNPGTETSPLATIGKALSIAQPGNTIIVKDGTYSETLSTQQGGTENQRITLKAENRGRVVVINSGRVLNISHPYITIEGIVFDGKFGADDLVDVSSNADNLILRDVEVRNGTRNGIDMSSPSNVLIENSNIHDFLWFTSPTERNDAHGIVTGGVKNLTVRNTEIYYVSGDSLQVQYDGWDNISIENCTFWNGPLPQDTAGALAGTNPGENAIDTKQYGDVPRGRIAIKNSTFYGWKGDLIANSAALNLKHNIEAVVDGNTFYDNEIALRLRGPGSKPGAWVTAMNNVLYNNNKAIRYEDGIENLRIYNNTFGLNNNQFFESAGGYGAGFEVLNNLFVEETKPQEANDTSNLAVSQDNFVDAVNNDYHLKRDSSESIDSGTTITEVEIDKNGISRPQDIKHDVGAYEFEFVGVGKPGKPSHTDD